MRNLDCDFHQQHFIDIYIGFALFALGEAVGAAGDRHAALPQGAAVASMRGLAGSIEGAAYLAAQDGRHERSARLLAAAARIRERTGMPLFSFWLPHHERAEVAVRAALGDDCERCVLEGQALLPEDAVREAALPLGDFDADEAQSRTNSAAGS